MGTLAQTRLSDDQPGPPGPSRVTDLDTDDSTGNGGTQAVALLESRTSPARREDAFQDTQHANRKTMTAMDVVYALKRQGHGVWHWPWALILGMKFFWATHVL